jgi:hypothetical protein
MVVVAVVAVVVGPLGARVASVLMEQAVAVEVAVIPL